LCVLAFLSVGDGGSEASKILGLCGFPNSTTFEKRSWGIIEKSLAGPIAELAEEMLNENLHREAELHFDNRRDTNNILLFDLWKEGKLQKEQWPKLTTAFDMAWQRRSSGRNHCSLSGHGCVVSMLTRKPMSKHALAKSCRICKLWHRRHPLDEPVREHNCVANFDADMSSGSMEPLAVLEMHKGLCHKQVLAHQIVSDDDASIRAKLKWSNADHMANNNTTEHPMIVDSKGNLVRRPDHGGTPGDMPEPTFANGPGHRKKTLKGELHRMVAATVNNKKTMTKCDCVRISTNFACMSRTLPKVDQSLWEDKAKAVLERHFDNHQHCGNFCRRNDETTEEKEAKRKFCRDKEKDKELCDWLEATLGRFIALEALIEVGHGMDALANESLNNATSWIAPKNKTHSTSGSLNNRTNVALGVNGIGTLDWCRRLFAKINVTVTADALHCLQMINKAREKRNAKSKTVKAKRERQERFHNILKKHTEDAKKQRAKRDGMVCCPGIGMQGGHAVAPTQKNKPSRTTVICPRCGKKGHKTTKSKKCDFHVNDNKDAAVQDPPQDTQQHQRDAVELHLLDQMSFDDTANDTFFDEADHGEVSDGDVDVQCVTSCGNIDLCV